MAKPIKRKELRQPDEFVTFWTRVVAAAAARRSHVLAGLAALVLVAVGVVGFAAWRERASLSASRALERVQRIAVADLLPAAGEAPKSEDGVAHYKTARERAEAALKETDAFLGTHGGSALADEARLLRGRFLIDLGRHDEAIAVYGQLVGGRLDRELRFLAHEGLAIAHEAKGELDQAIAVAGRLVEESAANAGFYRDRALYQKARLLEKKGSPKEAEPLYREVLDKIPGSSLRDEITDRLAALDAK